MFTVRYIECLLRALGADIMCGLSELMNLCKCIFCVDYTVRLNIVMSYNDVCVYYRDKLLSIELCRHLTVWRDMCTECGLDLRE